MDNSDIGRLDAVMSPVCALPAFLHNTADKVGLGGAYAIQYNVTGFPGWSCDSFQSKTRRSSRKKNDGRPCSKNRFQD